MSKAIITKHNAKKSAENVLAVLHDGNIVKGMNVHTRALYADAVGILEAIRSGVIIVGVDRLGKDLVAIAQHHPNRDNITTELEEAIELAAHAGLSISECRLDIMKSVTMYPQIEDPKDQPRR